MASTPQNVAKIATKTDAIDMSGMSLLGTMVEASGPKALLRLSTG